MKTTVQILAKTHTGLVRMQNEDNFVLGTLDSSGVWTVPSLEVEMDQEALLFCVADGMGGENAGEIASEIAVQSVQKFIQESIGTEAGNTASTYTNAALICAHNNIKRFCQEHPDYMGMGTTAILGLIQNQRLHLSWVGDSRLYRYAAAGKITKRNFGSGHLELLTDDHSKVWDMVLHGLINPEEARTHPESNLITQSLGDVFSTPNPGSLNIPIFQDDFFLACSDGLNGMLSDAEIAECFDTFGSDVTQLAEELINKANQKGGVDNITLILVKIVQGTLPDPSQFVKEDPKSISSFKTVAQKPKTGLKYKFMIAVVILLFTAITVATYKQHILIYNSTHLSKSIDSSKIIKTNSSTIDSTQKKDSVGR